jgi:hypothetical protein
LDKLRIKFGVLETEKSLGRWDRGFLERSNLWRDSYGRWAIGILLLVIYWAYEKIAGDNWGLLGAIGGVVLHFCETKVYWG